MGTKCMFVLFESAHGYGLFEHLECDEIGASSEAVIASMQDLAKFGKAIKLTAFLPFKNALESLQNINDVSEGILNDGLKSFLEMNIPRAKGDGKSKKKGAVLGVTEKNLASAIMSELDNITCTTDEIVQEISRGLRLFAPTLFKEFAAGDLESAQLGLGHSYSRAKVKFNVHRSDNMIIQSSALLDLLDKDINTFAMRMREWYGWHFPELNKLVSDNARYARLALAITDKSALGDDEDADLAMIREALSGGSGEEADDNSLANQAQLILDAAKSSMGTDVNPLDMINIKNFAKRVLGLVEYRQKLFGYLGEKMELVAPNLSSLIGEIVGARLISHAGSLTNLSKFPASTVQILGAEKALFRALKTKGKTPKYGLIYHSSFIGRAGTKNKGRISRYLANKCSIASRIDCFSEDASQSSVGGGNDFGKALRAQVEERLNFYEKGTQPTKNMDVMNKVIKKIAKKTAAAVVEDTAKSVDVDGDAPKKAAKKSSKKKATKGEKDDGQKEKKQKSSTPHQQEEEKDEEEQPVEKKQKSAKNKKSSKDSEKKREKKKRSAAAAAIKIEDASAATSEKKEKRKKSSKK